MASPSRSRAASPAPMTRPVPDPRERRRSRAATFLCAIAFALIGCAAAAQPAPAPGPQLPASGAAAEPASPALEGRALLAALRAGGYVLYLRHTSTDFSKNDAAMTTYADCASQRNLTDAGRAEARAIGAALRKLRIPVGDVLASPYCRTMETGRLVFGRAVASPAVRGGPAQPDSSERYAQLRQLLSTPVTGHTNTAIASHGNPFHGVAGSPYLAEGEMAVVRPEGGGRFVVVARIKRTDWAPLAIAQ